MDLPGLFVLVWRSEFDGKKRYIDYRSRVRSRVLSFTPCVFQAKTWVKRESAYKVGLDLADAFDMEFEIYVVNFRPTPPEIEYVGGCI